MLLLQSCMKHAEDYVPTYGEVDNTWTFFDGSKNYYGTFATHPILHTTPGQGEDPEVYAAFAALVPDLAAMLAGLGIPDQDPVPLIRTLRSALHGFVSLEASGGFGLPQDVDASFETMVDVLLGGMLARR